MSAPARDPVAQLLLEFAADNRIHAQRVEPFAIQRCVEPERADARAWVQAPDARENRPRQTRRGVHRQMKPDDVRRPDVVLGQPIP